MRSSFSRRGQRRSRSERSSSPTPMPRAGSGASWPRSSPGAGSQASRTRAGLRTAPDLSVLPSQKIHVYAAKTVSLHTRSVTTSIPRRGGNEDSGEGARQVARPAHGSSQARKRHQGETRPAQKGFESGARSDRQDPQQPTRVRRDREGVRHADGRAQVRSGEGGAFPEPSPHQPVEDGGRPLRPPAD